MNAVYSAVLPPSLMIFLTLSTLSPCPKKNDKTQGPNIDYMFLPKNGMAMFTSETGQQALSLLQQLPGKVGCDVQRSRCVEEKIPEPNFSLTPLLTMRRSICHYSLP